MSEALRPHESASVDEGLRIRLEGSIELLEDALPLLDSLRYLLARAENSRDDVATLHECVNQLPRIDEAIDKANRHETAHGLTQAVGARREQALIAANERLVTLGQPEAPSLRAAVSAILELLKRQGVPPRVGEVHLMESPGANWVLALLVGSVVASVFFLFDWPIVGAGFGAMSCILALYFRGTEAPWILLPDRLFLPASWPRLSRELAPGSIQSVRVDARGVTLALEQEALHLRSQAPKELASKLRLLSSPWLSALQSPARAFVVLDAVDDSTQQKGRALVSREGVLFVPRERRALLISALTPHQLPTEPTIDDALQLIAHLPEGRWDALGEHLERSADAKWLSAGDLDREENVVRAGEKRVRLVLAHAPRRLEAEEILKAF